MALMKREYVTIPGDPIVNELEPIFDGKATNLQNLRLKVPVKVVVQKECAHLENALDLLRIC